MRTAILIVPVLALFAVGCHQSSDGRSQTEVLPSGLVRVTNSGEPGWTSETAWRLDFSKAVLLLAAHFPTFHIMAVIRHFSHGTAPEVD